MTILKQSNEKLFLLLLFLLCFLPSLRISRLAKKDGKERRRNIIFLCVRLDLAV